MKRELYFAAMVLVFNVAYAATTQSTLPVTKKPIISEYWCGPDEGCKNQPNSKDFSDLNPAVTDVFVAFALTDATGKVSFNLSAGQDPQR